MCVSCSKRRSSDGNRTKRKEVCSHLYTELINLDLMVIDMFKINKRDKTLLETNKLLRGWINNLGTKCPDYEELNITRDFIENEYTKYFK